MSIVPKILRLYFAPRIKAIEYFKAHPIEVQQKQYARLVKAGAKTAFGKEKGIQNNKARSVVSKVPVMKGKAPYCSFPGV